MTTPHPVPTTFFRSPKLQRQLDRRARHPAATAAQAAEAHGLTHGSLNLHHIPWLNFQTPEEWIAWLNGWRRGQARTNAMPPTLKPHKQIGKNHA